MKIVKINPKNPEPRVIDEAVDELRRGGVVVYPTDTCYGIGVDISNIFAVEKVYKIKSRYERKPLSVIVNDLEMIQKIALVEEHKKEILKKYLPGPYTFFLLNLDYKNFKHPIIAVRIPNYTITLAIANKFGKPYATTSANISGFEPSYSVADFMSQIKNNRYQPDLILDAGKLSKNLPSTIVDISTDKPRIIRAGSGKFEWKGI